MIRIESHSIAGLVNLVHTLRIATSRGMISMLPISAHNNLIYVTPHMLLMKWHVKLRIMHRCVKAPQRVCVFGSRSLALLIEKIYTYFNLVASSSEKDKSKALFAHKRLNTVN